MRTKIIIIAIVVGLQLQISTTTKVFGEEKGETFVLPFNLGGDTIYELTVDVKEYEEVLLEITEDHRMFMDAQEIRYQWFRDDQYLLDINSTHAFVANRDIVYVCEVKKVVEQGEIPETIIFKFNIEVEEDTSINKAINGIDWEINLSPAVIAIGIGVGVIAIGFVVTLFVMYSKRK